ncbi:14917_t:CDS:2 [Acaulospora colombiana]|uniref:14917_t:CDS:1 n=1 Tax=Acaulospora colombiana TaxID=27376 RepID=A0ACA9N8K7_9GLOM|nr:14917_t:CDS:2 [Acaulospora colombiana]
MPTRYLAGFHYQQVVDVRCEISRTPPSAPPLSTLLPEGLELLGMYEAHDGDWGEEGCVACIKRLLIDKSPSCMPCLQVITDQHHPQRLSPLVEFAAERKVKIELEAVDV